MKYKQCVYTALVVTVGFLNSTTTAAAAGANDGSYEETERSNNPSGFTLDLSRCIEERQYEITKNVAQGKQIILNCFKATMMMNILRYLGEPSTSNVKFFNGMFELEKVNRKFDKRKAEYVRMYRKAMEKLINERKRLNFYRNQTEEEKEKQLERINENSEAFLSEVLKNLGNEKEEKEEEEKIKREMADPKLISMLDALTKNYLLRFRFYPGVAARMMRNDNGGFTFDIELQEDVDGQQDEQVTSDESSTREIGDGPQAKDDYIDDYDDDDDDDEDNNKKKKKRASRGDQKKKKKKELKKKAKKLKKIIPYLLLPMLIQMTLLPFVFKKLFFLAMKALFAGKVALILVGFNLLRNTCIKNDDEYQKIRVEHYGYRKGEEYGAWINGRSLLSSLSEEPFRAYRPQSSSSSSSSSSSTS